MALKLEIKGIVSHTAQAVALNNGNFVQEIVITQPAGVDDFGQPVGKQQDYPIKVFKDNREDFQRAEILNKKVHAICYLNGREFTTSNGIGYSLQLNLKDLKILN
jgi:hypothetical protein